MRDERIAYLDELRAELVGGIRRARRRQRRRVGAGLTAGLAALVAAVVLTLVPLDRGPSPALAVTRAAGWLELRVADVSAGPERLTRELRAAGVPGQVRVVPASPSLVGRWAVIEQRPSRSRPSGAKESPEELARLAAIDFRPEVVRVPLARLREATSSFVFYAGRAPRAGEKPTFSASAFEEGEPLHCSGIERLSASEAVRAVERLGLRAVWATEPGEPPSMQAPAGGVRNAQLAAQQGPGQSPTTPAGTVVLFGEEHRDEVPPAPTQRCS